MLREIKRKAGELWALVNAIGEEEWDELSRIAEKELGGPLNRLATNQRLTELQRVARAKFPDDPEDIPETPEITEEILIHGDTDN